MAGVQQCRFDYNSSYAYQMLDGVNRWFGFTEDDLAAKCGRFVRGKHKGKVRGWIVWRKCIEGGWNFKLNGVVKPGMMFARFCLTYDESCEMMNAPTDEFFMGAVRVDTAYGHDPVKARADRAAAEVAAAAKLERDKADIKARKPRMLARIKRLTLYLVSHGGAAHTHPRYDEAFKTIMRLSELHGPITK